MSKGYDGPEIDDFRGSGGDWGRDEDRDSFSGWLTVHEVAELLSVPASWVYGRTRKRSLQRLPGYRLGKYWRFREDEIHAWVKSQGSGRNA